MEGTIAIKTSNMAYPVPYLKDLSKNVAPTEKPDKREAISNTKTRFRLYVYMFLYNNMKVTVKA